MPLYALTIFLSAFLLFAVQPIIAKIILPWFGGSSAVWSTCMLFFQAMLLLGYLYAHWLHSKLQARKQAFLHIGALVLAAVTLPIIPNPAWKVATSTQPSLRILLLLTVTLGLPYFLLASTSPLLQAWYSRTHKHGMPYRLFALSNLASMMALLSYPLLIEPNLSTRFQAWAWSGGFAAFAICCGLTAWRTSTQASVEASPAAASDADSSAVRPTWTLRFLWLGLAASASVLLLAITNFLTQDVAAIPFLWILPLAVYLLSFIICFESPRLYYRPVFIPLFVVSICFFTYRIWPGRPDFHWPWFLHKYPLRPFIEMDARDTIKWSAAALFAICMVCHGELARLKPHPRFLTSFYVTVSMGGAVGGLFVGLIAPAVFAAFFEFPIGLAVCVLVVMAVLLRRFFTGVWQSVAATAALALVLCPYAWCLTKFMKTATTGYRVMVRNFYAQLRVEDIGRPDIDPDAARALIHGVINHGEQMRREEYRRMPVTYFCPNSGVGRAMKALEGHPRHLGVLGLGCGTLAAYGRAGDTLSIYEINPQVRDLARTEFTYVADTAAKVEFFMGDGRLSLENQPTQNFDILVMDAFSGDSVPVHLLTHEALATYFRHLKPDGILIVNITNRYLNLKPVMERGASAFHKVALVYDTDPPESDFLCFGASWALIMDPKTLDAHPELLADSEQLKPMPTFRAWTDDFSNMYAILK